MASKPKRVKADVVWRPANVTLQVARAIKAVNAGEASAQQQKLAMHWIIHFASGIAGEVFVPQMPDAVTYLVGRRSVGIQIVDIIVEKSEVFRGEGEEDQ